MSDEQHKLWSSSFTPFSSLLPWILPSNSLVLVSFLFAEHQVSHPYITIFGEPKGNRTRGGSGYIGKDNIKLDHRGEGVWGSNYKAFGSDVRRYSPVTAQVVRKNVCNKQLLWTPLLFHKGFFFWQSRNCRLLKEDFGPWNWPALVSVSMMLRLALLKSCKYLTVLDVLKSECKMRNGLCMRCNRLRAFEGRYPLRAVMLHRVARRWQLA